jgi:lysophospholipase L1-like esterase
MKPMPPTFAERLFSWGALPVAFVQGKSARRRSLRMPPAEGLHGGTIAAGDQRDEVLGGRGGAVPIRLLVIGDSTAQGVGVGVTADSLAAKTARELNRLTGRIVHWRMAGANSATSADLRDHVVPHVEPRDFTHVLLTVGTNDAKNYHTGRRFCRAFGGLIYAVRTRFPEARIVWSPPIDMRTMPLLQPLLGRVLNIRARHVTGIGAQICYERGVVAAPSLPIHDVAGFAADGFHPGPLGCRYWAEHVAPVLLDEGHPPRLPPQP